MSWKLNNIKKPALLLDKDKAMGNLSRMLHKARQNNLVFRPHFKTHQSLEIGTWIREQGVEKITVSSVEMARFFANNGWTDITIAFPVNIREINEINQLAAEIDLNLTIVNAEVLHALAKQIKNQIGVFIKIDVGYQRAGILPANTSELDTTIRIFKESAYLRFMGFLAHSGHTYHAKTRDEIHQIHQDSIAILTKIKDQYSSMYPELILSVGDTPSCSLADHFSGIDEIRPGNFIFYDLQQTLLGSCSFGDVAVALACPVVDVQTRKNKMLLYGGSIHLSKEPVLTPVGLAYGQLAIISSDGWTAHHPHAFVTALSQEHGTVSFGEATKCHYKPGDLALIIPVHSCTTANLMKCYNLKSGEIIKHRSWYS
jgi:D-serine deaminase-like pyridoxal phosphate-dependent protein